MSDDPEGVLFYGYSWPFEDDAETEIDFDSDLDTIIRHQLLAAGVPALPHYPGDRSDKTAWKAWIEVHRPEIDAWNARVAQAKAKIGVDWGNQGSWEYRGTYLYALESRKAAEWGNAQPVADLTVGPDWRAKLDAFLASQNITPPEGENQPGWWLTSFYG